MIPHRPPFLWIDRVVELECGVRCVSLKNFHPADDIFAGHFPGNAILPGVIIIEAAAQTAAVMLASSASCADPAGDAGGSGSSHILAAVNRFKFLKPVRPGQELRIEIRKIAGVGSMACVEASAWIGDQVVAKGELVVVTRSAQHVEGETTAE